jgi:ribosomal protein S18 acetylase RimI-like enzyme
MSIFKDIIDSYIYISQQQGWRQAFIQATQFLTLPFYEAHSGYVLTKSLSEPIHIPDPEIDVAIEFLDPEKPELINSIMPPIRVKRIIHKLQAGEYCCIAIREKKVISYVLAGFEGTPSTISSGLNLTPNEAYLWAGYALPEYRRMGLVMAVNLHLCKYLQEMEYKIATLLVERKNKASLGHCAKMGYEITETIEYRRLLKWVNVSRVPYELSD